MPYELLNMKDDDGDGDQQADDGKSQKQRGMRYAEKIKSRQPQGLFKEEYQRLQEGEQDESSSDDEDILVLKKRHDPADFSDHDSDEPLDATVDRQSRKQRRKHLKDELRDIGFEDETQVPVHEPTTSGCC
jgi:hypothetical protein